MGIKCYIASGHQVLLSVSLFYLYKYKFITKFWGIQSHAGTARLGQLDLAKIRESIFIPNHEKSLMHKGNKGSKVE